MLIAQGRILDVVGRDAVPAGVPLDDVGERVVMPGLVDSHVHINEPGRTAWEGFESATRAAAAGGITTLADMPLNCVPVTTTAAALRQKIEAARGAGPAVGGLRVLRGVGSRQPPGPGIPG